MGGVRLPGVSSPPPRLACGKTSLQRLLNFTGMHAVVQTACLTGPLGSLTPGGHTLI